MGKNFEDLLIEIKQSDSQDLDVMHEKAKKEQVSLRNCLLVINIVIIIFLSSVFKFSFDSIFLILYLIIPILLINVFLYIVLSNFFLKSRKLYLNSFKNKVIRKMMCNFYNITTYSPDSKMPKDIYNEGKFNEYYNRYYSDDYMEGMLDNKSSIKMAEVHTVHEETTTDSDGHTSTTTTTKFHGLFAKIQLNKSINSNLLIRRNHSFFGKKRLDMDSQDFEKIFDVSTTNQIIGMQLLTHDIMDLLLSFREKTNINFDISIYENIMYLRFHTGPMFELKSLKKGVFDEALLKRYYDVLNFTYKLSKMLIDLIDKTEL